MKYMGKIYEGRWKVVSMKKSENGNIDGYYLENVYNQQRIYVNKSTLARIVSSSKEWFLKLREILIVGDTKERE